MKKPLVLALLITTGILFPSISNAHFLWLLSKNTPDKNLEVEIYFGEIAEPDDPSLLKRIKDVKVVTMSEDGHSKPLKMNLTAESLASVSEKFTKPQAICLNHTYGLMTRGGSSFVLKYYAKTYSPNLSNWAAFPTATQNDLDIVPSQKEGQFSFKVLLKGKPLQNAELKIYGDDIDDIIETHTDKNGEYQCKLPLTGVYSIRAKHVEDSKGKLKDEEYSSIRHYSTLVLNFSKPEKKE